jgi:hypothetical protein
LSGMNRHVVTMRGLRRRWLASASLLFHAFRRCTEPKERPIPDSEASPYLAEADDCV